MTWILGTVAAESLPRGTEPLATLTPSQQGGQQDHQPQRGRQVAVQHFLPCLGQAHRAVRIGHRGLADAVGGMMRGELAVAAGPVRAAQPGIGQADVGAERHHETGEQDGETDQLSHVLPLFTVLP